ncbi:hypothetical protein K488DRAFT_70380 [Vararia minispora EC-137]|uniref:Uncharacterized protein n=1 Tax=Vararia minispora EC-137 TaxID=1314806 RepID=A0ACB8QLX5_9AGAM|nr:hypothetical protein K488DRAFT_70380 [Vararia minispora EC-137]
MRDWLLAFFMPPPSNHSEKSFLYSTPSASGDSVMDHRSPLPTPRTTPSSSTSDAQAAIARSAQSSIVSQGLPMLSQQNPAFLPNASTVSPYPSSQFGLNTQMAATNQGQPFSSQPLQPMIPLISPSFPAGSTVQFGFPSQHIVQAQALPSLPPAQQQFCYQPQEQLQQNPYVLQSLQAQAQTLLGLQQVFNFAQSYPMSSQQQLYAIAALQELQSFDLNNPLRVETLLSVERHGQNNPIVVRLLEMIRANLPSTSDASQPLDAQNLSQKSQLPIYGDSVNAQPTPILSASRKRRSSQIESAAYDDSQPVSHKTAKKPVVTSSASKDKGKGRELTINSEKLLSSRRVSTTTSDAYLVAEPGSRLFTSPRGRQLRIFENGGKIEADPLKADYCVLEERASTCEQYRKQAATVNCPVVSHSFVLDCIAVQELLDPKDYALDEAAIQKGKRPVPDFFAEPRSKTAANAPSSDKGKARAIDTSGSGDEGEEQGDEEKMPPVKGRVKTVKKLSVQKSRSPSPGGYHGKPVPFAGGRFKFTDAELEYAWKVLRRHAEQYPEANLNSTSAGIIMGEKVFSFTRETSAYLLPFNKIEYHTVKSWQGCLEKRRSTLERVVAEGRRRGRRRIHSSQAQSESTVSAKVKENGEDTVESIQENVQDDVQDGDQDGDEGSLDQADVRDDASSNDKDSNVDQLVEEVRPSREAETPALPSGLQEDEREDIELAVQYFIDNDVDEDDEDKSWQELERKARIILLSSYHLRS